MSRQMLRYMVVLKGTEGSPVLRLEMEFRCAAGYEEEYVNKIVRGLSPAVEVDAGPWPMDLVLEYVGPT